MGLADEWPYEHFSGSAVVCSIWASLFVKKRRFSEIFTSYNSIIEYLFNM